MDTFNQLQEVQLAQILITKLASVFLLSSTFSVKSRNGLATILRSNSSRGSVQPHMKQSVVLSTFGQFHTIQARDATNVRSLIYLLSDLSTSRVPCVRNICSKSQPLVLLLKTIRHLSARCVGRFLETKTRHVRRGWLTEQK